MELCKDKITFPYNLFLHGKYINYTGKQIKDKRDPPPPGFLTSSFFTSIISRNLQMFFLFWLNRPKTWVWSIGQNIQYTPLQIQR